MPISKGNPLTLVLCFMARVGVESAGKCQAVNPDLLLLLFAVYFNSLRNLLLKWPTVSSYLTWKTYTVVISEILKFDNI